MPFIGTLLAAWMAAALTPTPAAAQAEAVPKVDLELVLAVDVSHSMDAEEQKVQRDGYVQAFRSPEVIDAIASGVLGRIAVIYVEWSDPGVQYVVMPWTMIDGKDAGYRFADALGRAELHSWQNTSISDILLFSINLLDHSGFSGTRRAIDVSGDGPNNAGVPVLRARDVVVSHGITINGLPITLRHDRGISLPGLDIDNLDDYFRECVIGGPNAFMFVVNRLDEFATAIRRKMVQEIAGSAADPTVIPVENPALDCMIGERMRRGLLQ